MVEDAAARVTLAEHHKWQSFYKDRARPCPFFGLAPDENLSEWVEQGLLVPGNALDVGCGNARNAIFLARHGFNVQAIDYSASAALWAREEVARARASVQVHQVSIFDFEVERGSCDLVYDSGCFHHIAPHRRDDYVRLLAHALRPGGTLGLVCFTPEGGSGYSDEQVYRRASLGGGLGYDEHRLRELLQPDFRIESLRRMRDQPDGSGVFGKQYLWALRAVRQ